MPYYRASSYRHRPSRRYRGYGSASSPVTRRQFLWAAGAGAAGAVAIKARGTSGSHPARAIVADAVKPPAVSPAAARAIAYARRQLGKPYEWGATGPDSFDCSGLVWAAWRAAGVTIPRTTFDQWKYLRHVSHADLQPGDLVLFGGSDGSVANPGHVVMYIGGGQVIQAYATGFPVRINSLASMGTGDLTGYARP